MRVRTREAGFGLLAVFVLTVLLGATLLAGYIWLNSQQVSQRAEDIAGVLEHTDRALRGFALTQYRLPCPDTSGDGFEDCDSNAARGRLPWRTLNLEDRELRAEIGHMAYLVDREGADLTVAENRFQPGQQGTAEYRFFNNGEDGNDEFHDYDFVTTTDFCLGLEQAAAEPGARVADELQTPVAYAIAHPGGRDMDGSGSLFDGLNADDSGLLFESPARGPGPGYDDRVLARSHGSLATGFDCRGQIVSLDTLSLASATVDRTNDAFLWTTIGASSSALVSGVLMGVQIKGIVTAAGQISAAVTQVGIAAAALASAIAGCVVIVGCAAVPGAIAFLVAAIAALVAAITAMVAAIAALGLHAVAFGLHLGVAVAAGVNIDQFDTDIDLSEVRDDIQSGLDEARDEMDDAESDLDDAESDLADARDDHRDARQAMFDAARALIDERNDRNEVGGNLSRSHLDGVINQFIDRSETVESRRLELERALSRLEQAEENRDGFDGGSAPEPPQEAIDELDDLIAEAEDALAQTDDEDEQLRLQTEIDALRDARDDLADGFGAGDQDEAGSTAEFEAAMAQIRDQINDLEAQLDENDLSPEREAELREQIEELEDTEQELARQFSEIDTDVAARQSEVNTAESRLDTALDRRASAYDLVVSRFRLSYRTEDCEEDDDGNEQCTTETGHVEARFLIRLLMDAYIEVLEEFRTAEENREDARRNYEDSVTSVEQLEDALETFDGPDVDVEDQDALNIFSGDMEILEEATGRGGTR
ncbi:hypothetical protein IC757_14290 [Wenzhouxiangella sp. AB-CW3]|uniref:hypothetical protein n=1 Tax=Wenzhouxiangella sp. AB-CW3 TaxID=2771012 RepID=UPI00168A52EE|nr:hypothetical protein [Wenzhouxiangella sp. AB-CW3]QOC22172.1 hypothetical protein IC757_14290 [Wenzhouxiangella sp. AB-CW3]